MIAAIISTADALTNAVSANITQDFNLRLGKLSQLSVAKVISGVVGLGALVASYFVPKSIIGIMIESYALSVTALLVPLLYVLFDGKRTKRAGLAATLAGLATFLVLTLFPIGVPKELVAIGVSWLAFFV